ncbi:glycosyl transferase family protein [Shimia ponticola]|uniref:glycosyl transferase family protein n=1 Tax=Shimia ponticola TaxID=2582893 RepID=UPI0011BEDCFA|nr:glycosyl transferase family protein [Shimia ponticola]
MMLADYVRILGRGPGRSRSLTQDEARHAMTLMLEEEAAPEAVGAILMLLRMKGETAEEIAGFASAAQIAMPQLPSVDLDWPTYAAGRTRGAPWFLRSAKQVAEAGHTVLLHGWNGSDPKVRAGLATLGIRQTTTPDATARCLETDGIAYLPLEEAHPALFRLLNLRSVLGLRSCVNTVCRLLNPAQARASVQGVFHPSYRLLQADAAALLGWDALTVVKGGGGEFELNPAKSIAAFGLRAGASWEASYPAAMQVVRRLSEPTGHALSPRWHAQKPDTFERMIIEATTHAALDTIANHTASKQTAA